jgi:hypothetical protein
MQVVTVQGLKNGENMQILLKLVAVLQITPKDQHLALQ